MLAPQEILQANIPALELVRHAICSEKEMMYLHVLNDTFLLQHLRSCIVVDILQPNLNINIVWIINHSVQNCHLHHIIY